MKIRNYRRHARKVSFQYGPQTPVVRANPYFDVRHGLQRDLQRLGALAAVFHNHHQTRADQPVTPAAAPNSPVSRR